MAEPEQLLQMRGIVKEFPGVRALDDGPMLQVCRDATHPVITVLGVTGLWPAILADTGATVLVTLNALRLLAWRPPGTVAA